MTTIPILQPPQGAQPRSSGMVLALVALSLLTLFNVAAFPQAAFVIDSGRDIANAWLISQAAHFPLTGPDIYGTWKLGPAWFYFLSVPLLFGGSLTTLALWVGVFASLKVPLAFILGRRCYGLAGGLGFAAASVMPGWSTTGMLVVAHTCMIETMVLASIVVSSWAQRAPSIHRLSLASLTLSLAMHAHPTAVVVAPWLLVAWWRGWQAGHRGLAISAMLAAFVLPWLPMLYAEFAAGWPQIAATQVYLQESRTAGLFEESFAAMRGLITGWPPLLSEFLLPMAGNLGAGLDLVWYGALAVAAVGLLVAARTDPKLTAIVLLQAVFALLTICALRPQAPVYMYLALFPLLTWALIHGWSSALGRRAGRVFFTALAGLAAFAQIAVLVQRSEYLKQGNVPIPGAAFANVAAKVEDDGAQRFWLAAKDQEDAVSSFCSNDWALHGELATALNLGSNVAIERACANGQRPHIGGQNARRHAVGLPVFVANQLRVAGTHLVPGWVALKPDEVLFPASGRAPEVHPEYAVVRYQTDVRPAITRGISAVCTGQQVIAVTNLAPGLNGLQIVATASSAKDGERVAQPVLATLAATYFACNDSQRVVLSITTSNQAAVDIVTFTTSK